MTTIGAPNRGAINEPAAMPAGMISVFKHILFMNRLDFVLPEGRKEPEWFEPVIQAMANLPWDEDNWKEGAVRTQPNAAAHLLALLAEILDGASPAPAIVPTWQGGVHAEWHQHGVYLEIEAAPDTSLEYYFLSDIEEYEGPLTSDNLPILIRQAHQLLADTEQRAESDD